MRFRLFGIVLTLIILVCLFFGCSSKGGSTDARTTSETASEDASSESAEVDGSSDGKAETSQGDSTESQTVTVTDKGSTKEKKNRKHSENAGDAESEKTENGKTGSIDNSDMVSIVFQDEEGNVIKSEEIKKGEDATPPEEPEKEGYKFEGWNYDYDDVQTDLIITPIFEEITEPTLVVKNVTVNAGDKVDVVVSVYNNPGFLSMLANIQYDEKVMTLRDVTNGSLLDDYVFTPPKNMKTDCNAAWNINDIPEGKEDGEVMVLHFKMSNNAKAGKYPISVSWRKFLYFIE